MTVISVDHIYNQYFVALPRTQRERPIRSISGTVTALSEALTCKVTLHDQKTRNVIRETFSDAMGKYSFRGLPHKSYFVMALHPVPNYNAVIQDNVVPE